MEQAQRVMIVTGGSSGIGAECAKALTAAGCRVYEFSRRERDTGSGVIHYSVDVTAPEQVHTAVEEILRLEGRIDGLVCCAGFGISGAAEYTEPAAAHAQLETNLFGVDNVVRAVLPGMRERGNGRIVCVSSVAGAIPIPFQLWYSVSKAGVNAYCLALRNEVRPYGISVCAVLPGDIATGFTGARQKTQTGDDVYQGRISRSVRVMEQDEQNGMTAAYAGRYVARCALKKNSRPLMTMGLQYKAFMLLKKLLPEEIVNRIVGMIYAR